MVEEATYIRHSYDECKLMIRNSDIFGGVKYKMLPIT